MENYTSEQIAKAREKTLKVIAEQQSLIGYPFMLLQRSENGYFRYLRKIPEHFKEKVLKHIGDFGYTKTLEFDDGEGRNFILIYQENGAKEAAAEVTYYNISEKELSWLIEDVRPDNEAVEALKVTKEIMFGD